MAALVIYQVGARYLFGSPPSWTEELARFLQVWLVLLASPDLRAARDAPRGGLRDAPFAAGGGAGPPDRRVADLRALLPGPRLLRRPGLLAVAGFQTSPALGISMVWPYLAVPVSGVLMAVAAGVLIVAGFRRGAEDDER